MKLADEVAGLAAIKYCAQRVVTVGMDRMVFRVPIYIAELVTLRATVNAAWRTSMEVGVRVEAESPIRGEVRHTNTGTGAGRPCSSSARWRAERRPLES